MDLQIQSELRLLVKTMDETKLQLKFRIENDNTINCDITDLDKPTTFGEVLYVLTKNVSSKQLLDMSDDEMVNHIQKVQLTEKENN